MTMLTPPAPPYWLAMLLRAIMAVVEGVTMFFRGIAWFGRTVNWGLAFAVTTFNWATREFLILPTPKHYWGAVIIRFCSSLIVSMGAGLVSGIARQRMIRDREELVKALRDRALAQHPDLPVQPH